MDKIHRSSLQHAKKARNAAYSLAAIAFLAGNDCTAQVVVTEVDPDLMVSAPEGVYYLDIDNDGLDDFQLSASSAATYLVTSSGGTNAYRINAVFASPIGTGNGIAASQGASSSFSYPDKLGLGILVGADLGFYSGFFQSVAYSFFMSNGTEALPIVQAGNWIGGSTDKFMGLSFQKEGNTHYGWLRMDVGSDNKSFTIKQYAYEATPEESIITDLPDLLVNQALQGFSLYSFGNEIIITATTDLTQETYLKVYDLSGALLLQTRLVQSAEKIKAGDLAPGIYVCTLQNNSGTFSAKLFLSGH